MADIAGKIDQLVVAIDRMNQRQQAMEQRLGGERGEIDPAPIVRALGRTISEDDLLKVGTWPPVCFLSDVQVGYHLVRLREHFGKQMKDGGSYNRDWYELEAILKVMKMALKTPLSEDEVDEDHFPRATMEMMREMMKRLVLLKEHTENGVESMKAVEKKLDEQGYEANIENALKDVRARQVTASLFRANQTGHADYGNHLPSKGSSKGSAKTPKP